MLMQIVIKQEQQQSECTKRIILCIESVKVFQNGLIFIKMAKSHLP